MSAQYIPPPSLPLSGGTMTGRINGVGITDLGTEFFGDQTPVAALVPVAQFGVGYNPSVLPSGSNAAMAIGAAAGSAVAGGTFTALQARATINGSVGMATLQGMKYDAIYNASAAITTISGIVGTARNTGGATASVCQSFLGRSVVTNASSVVTNSYDFFSQSPAVTVSGAITTQYGFYCQGSSISGVTTGIAFFANSATDTSRFGGSVSIGKTTAPSATLDVNGAILRKPFTVGTLPTGVVGMASFVSDALGPTFGAAVVGGGAVQIPVYYDGAWKVG